MIEQRVPVGTAQPTAHELRPGYCCRSLSASPVILRSYSLPGVPWMRWGMIPKSAIVADDALLRNPRARGIKDRCKAELNLLTRIEKASMEARDRCELVRRILSDDSIEAIDEILKKKEAAARTSTIQ